MNQHNDWRPHELAQAEKAWRAGHSASEIARTLPGRTRNAVIGIAHRRGWIQECRAKPSAPARIRREPVAKVVRAPKPPRPVKAPKPEKTVAKVHQRNFHAAEIVRAENEEHGRSAVARVASGGGVESPNARPLIDATGCKWPLGCPGEVLFCCNPIERGVYCAGHRALSLNPVQPAPRDQGERNARLLSRHDHVAPRRTLPANDGLWDQVAA